MHSGSDLARRRRSALMRRALVQFVEQSLRFFQVFGVEPLSELAIDLGEHRSRLVATAGIAEQAGEAGGRA